MHPIPPLAQYRQLANEVAKIPMEFTQEFTREKTATFPTDRDIKNGTVIIDNAKKGVYELVMRLWKDGRLAASPNSSSSGSSRTR